jgi:hypothetical protein
MELKSKREDRATDRNSYYSLFMLNEREQILDLVKKSVGSKTDLSGLMKHNSSNTLLPKRGHSRSMPSKTNQFELKRPKSGTQAKPDDNSEIRNASHPMKVTKPAGSVPVAPVATKRLARSWNPEETKPPPKHGITSIASCGVYFLVLAAYFAYYFYGPDFLKSVE